MYKAIFITLLTLVSTDVTAGTLWKCINKNGLAIYTPTPQKDLTACKILVQDDQVPEQHKEAQSSSTSSKNIEPAKTTSQLVPQSGVTHFRTGRRGGGCGSRGGPGWRKANGQCASWSD